MPGPMIVPQKAEEMQKSAGMNGFDAIKFANEIAKKQSAMQHPDTAAPMMDDHSIKQPPLNEHSMNMQNAALAAKQKYMQDNGVDEDGMPVNQ